MAAVCQREGTIQSARCARTFVLAVFCRVLELVVAVVGGGRALPAQRHALVRLQRVTLANDHLPTKAAAFRGHTTAEFTRA